jgi:CheY-like chemotaxis protein
MATLGLVADRAPAQTRSRAAKGPADFGALLVERQIITRTDLAAARHHAERERLELVDAVVTLGLATEPEAYAAFAAALGAPVIDLKAATGSELAVRLVPERLARRHMAVPFAVDNRSLTIATCRSLNPASEHDLSSASGRRARVVVATRSAVLEELDRCYRDRVPSEGVLATRALRKPRVLVTGDRPLTRMLVKALLEKEPLDVLEATNSAEAIEMATRERLDLLLVDLTVPEMDGYEAIGRLRRDISPSALPIVVITAEEGPSLEQRMVELGAADYIVKPFDPATLLSRVNAVFHRSSVVAA